MVESSTTNPPVEVRIAPATYNDLPGIATCERLAFSGAFPPYDVFSRLLHPFRVPLVRSGVHPRHWPDYNSTIRNRARNLRDGSIVFVAFAHDDDGKEMVVGAVKMTPPRDILEGSRRTRKWKDRVLDDVVYPTMENFRDKIWKDNDGTDLRFLSVFRELQREARDRLDNERQHFYLNLLYVHPSFHGRGVGSALLERCTSIADSHGTPMLLESSKGAFHLYKSRGFVQVDTIEFTYAGEHIQLPCMIREPVAPVPPPKDEDTHRSNEIVLGQDSDMEEKAL